VLLRLHAGPTFRHTLSDFSLLLITFLLVVDDDDDDDDDDGDDVYDADVYDADADVKRWYDFRYFRTYILEDFL
jgi:hypothetical protein